MHIPNTSRREFLKTLGLGTASLAMPGCLSNAMNSEKRPPNFVVIFADDLGYGDLGCYGHPTVRTVNLDRMAGEGAKLTQFYVAACVCTPSRAGIMTGRLPIRNGMCHTKYRVLFPDSGGGLPQSEITIAKALKSKNYATACIGKWHLGHLPQFLPMRHGFDYYYGIPYSNDMRPSPLMENETTIEEPAEQTTLTKRYTKKALRFIEQNKNKPFFLYFAHNFPHTPLFASGKFKDTSLRGLYGDVVEELDWSVGKVMDALKKYGLAKNTLVLFTSDNGPWLIKDLDGGSAGLLRGGKGSTWEGGMREPALAWWPGKIKPGSFITDITSTLDFFSTCCALAGVKPPKDRILDSYDISPLLLGSGTGPRKEMFFYRGSELYAVRQGPWKMHMVTQAGYRDKPHIQDPPLLFNLEHDPSEKFDVAKDHPEVIAKLKKLAEQHRATVKPVPSQLEIRLPK